MSHSETGAAYKDPVTGAVTLYTDVRELIDGYVRYECWNCGHPWMSRYAVLSDKKHRGICENCGWTPDRGEYDKLLEKEQ